MSIFSFFSQNSSMGRGNKHIFIGMDGTQNAAYKDTFATNVYHLGAAARCVDHNMRRQLIFYFPGVGTQSSNQYLSNIFGATGEGIELFILEAYINLVLNYNEGDRIYIFGFSRGAVAARALTGLISWSGLVKPDSVWLIDDAWKHFIEDSEENNFKLRRTNHIWSNTKIDFLGLWDTVPGPYKKEELERRFRFKNYRMDKSVQNGVHILSIDETRRDFLPLLWDVQDDDPVKPIQIWMPGVHSDIGGGYLKSTLANISLMAMIDIFQTTFPDVAFDNTYIYEHVVQPAIEDSIAINDEWKSYKVPLKFKATRELNEHFLFHPIMRKMYKSKHSIRGMDIEYDPFKSRSLFKGGIANLKLLTFDDNSLWKKTPFCN